MPIAQSSTVERETVVSARTSGTAGTATAATVTTVNGAPLEDLDQLLVYLQTTQNLAGTAPTMDVYLQIPLVPNPDPAVDAHWDDYAKLIQVTPTLGLSQVLALVVRANGPTVANNTFAGVHNRGIDQPGFIAGNQFPYHWGDRLRIRETMGGTVTTPAIYSIHLTGYRKVG